MQQHGLPRLYPPQPPTPAFTLVHSPKHAASQRSIQQRSVLRLHPPQHAERRLFRLQLLTAAFSSAASFDRTHSSMQQRTLLRLHAA